MKRAPLYSRPGERALPGAAEVRPVAAGAGAAVAGAAVAGAAVAGAAVEYPPVPGRWRRCRQIVRRHAVVGLLSFAVLGLAVDGVRRDAVPPPTQDDIDRAVLHTLETRALPSVVRRAADTVLPSVVRVLSEGPAPVARRAPSPRGKPNGEDPATEPRQDVGSGVVIIDSGVILTNLHVVRGAARIVVTFHDGFESEAELVGAHPEHDLAVLKAATVPDDLKAATMRSTADLASGDTVVAVGFPFGIGPSVSAGVVSGLGRQFEPPEGTHPLTNLIQFDAAANPGNSGGPLVTAEGEVVGIVTGILNPSRARTFVGIGFAVPIENAASAAGMPPF